MKFNRKDNKELLLQFKQTENPKELDEMLYKFEKEMNEFDNNYFLKESENPFIYFLEYPKPEELVRKLRTQNDYMIIPVTCVLSNMNHITSTILRKIRNKLYYEDTFEINCYVNTYCIEQTKENLENEITNQIENIIKIGYDRSNPVWIINVYVIGDIAAINIINSRNKKITQKMWT